MQHRGRIWRRPTDDTATDAYGNPSAALVADDRDVRCFIQVDRKTKVPADEARDIVIADYLGWFDPSVALDETCHFRWNGLELAVLGVEAVQGRGSTHHLFVTFAEVR